jgi:YD repeat-containing protein
MTHTFRYLCILVMFAISARTLAAQTVFVTATPTGTPPFSSSTAAGPDTIDLANLNVHLNVPVLNKHGRGMDFNYNLSYDSTIWVPTTSMGSLVWKPIFDWGWRGVTEATTGFMSANPTITLTCTIIKNGQPIVVGHEWQYDHWAYHEPDGTVHSITISNSTRYVDSIDCPDMNTSFANTATNDGSGFSIQATGNVGTLTTPGGTSFVPPTNTGFGVGTITDNNGNQISADASGNYYDTLTNPPNNPTLVIAGAGTAASPFTFSYPAPATSTSGVKAAYSMKFTAFTVQTNFGCGSPIEYPATSTNLVTEIDLPDIAVNPNSKYLFSYETTPGDTHTPHFVTARIATVTLPTGATITYSYSGGNNGINCSDGSTATLTRVTPDGTWTYAQVKNTAPASTTTVTDPAGNVSTIKFQGIYETQRVIDQGATTVLKTITTCYNGNPLPCSSASTTTAITLPITIRSVLDQYGSAGSFCKHDHFYNSTGMLTMLDDYDYPAASPLVRRQVIVPASVGTITSLPQSVTICDPSTGTAAACNGTGTVVAQTSFCYDEGTPSGTPSCAAPGSPTSTTGTPHHGTVSGSRGNLTTIARLTSSGATLGQKFTYYDTGNVNVATDSNGAQTTYTYGACGNSFPTSLAEPLSLSRQMTWDCNGGVQLTDVDENSKTATTSYTDAYFWRPASVQDRAMVTTNFCYGVLSSGTCQVNTTQTESILTFNSGASASDILTTVDSLGRPKLTQKRQSPSSANFDTTEQIYNNVGLPSRKMLPYVGTAGQANTTGSNVTTTFDALGRPTNVADSGSGSTSYFYNTTTNKQNDVLITVGPAPTGENTKRRQLEYDALGRIKSVCELTAATGSATCGQSVGQTGFWTKYTYDVLGDLKSVTQNAQAAVGQQTRNYSYDGLGRLTAEVNPESGTTSYTYDSSASCTAPNSFPSDLVKRVDANGNVACLTYDALHRVTSQTYSGPNAASTPNKYFTYDSATVNSVAMANAKTRLAEAYTAASPTGTKITDLGFSYTGRGEMSDEYQKSPVSANYYHQNVIYWENGTTKQTTGLSLSTFTYGLDGEGRVSSISASSGQNPLTSTSYSTASLPTTVTLGSGDSDAFTYDPNTNRVTKHQFNINGQAYSGTLTWNANGSPASLAIVDPFNAADAQTCTYAHDDLSRIAKVDCGATKWQQNFSYDAFGNLTKTVPTGGTGKSFQPTYSSSSNHITNNSGIVPSYDADGNVLNDGINAFTWDATGARVSSNGTSATIDALGRMVEVGSSQQVFYGIDGSLTQIISGVTRLARIPLPGGGTANYDVSSGGLNAYAHADNVGTMRLFSNPNRTINNTMALAPFGEPYAQLFSSGAVFTENPRLLLTRPV